MVASYDKRSSRWRFRFVFDGKRYSGSAPAGSNTKKSAERAERAVIEKLERGRYRPAGEMPTVAQLSERFLAYQAAHCKPLTVELHTIIVRKHILPHIGRLKVDKVGKRHLDELKTTWVAAARTKNTRLGVVQRMLELASEWELIDRVPRVKNIKIPKDHPRFLSDDEQLQLLEASRTMRKGPSFGEWSTMLLIALRTGLRVGELRGLKWGDVVFAAKGGALTVRRTEPGRGDMVATAPKGNRPRTIPLTPDARACLLSLYESSTRRESGDWVWTCPPVRRNEKDRYGPRTASSFDTVFARIVERTKIPNPDEVSWHSCRHTFASALVMRGVPLSVVQELLGHSSVRQTERYSHLAPGYSQQHAVIALLDLPIVGFTPTNQLPPGDDED